MRSRILIVPALLFALLVAGCGSSSGNTTAGASSANSTSSTSVSPSSSMSMSSSSGSSATTGSTSCPTANTKNFAKTRFLTDMGGSLFLMNRYVLQPYKAGKFTKGASGRTFALVKAGVAAATTAKLLKNAATNAKANPTLCRTVAGPLTQLSGSLGGLVGTLKSGSVNPGAIAGLGGLLSTIKSGASKAGLPITEQQIPLGG